MRPGFQPLWCNGGSHIHDRPSSWIDATVGVTFVVVVVGSDVGLVVTLGALTSCLKGPHGALSMIILLFGLGLLLLLFLLIL